MRIPLAGIRLIDSRTGEQVDMGALSGVTVLSLIRHRF